MDALRQFLIAIGVYEVWTNFKIHTIYKLSNAIKRMNKRILIRRARKKYKDNPRIRL